MIITKQGVGAFNWLEAAVFSAVHGIIFTAGLVVGVAAVSTDDYQVISAGVIGLIMGGFSLAAVEIVSAAGQVDTDRAELDRERAELTSDVITPRSTTPAPADRIQLHAAFDHAPGHLPRCDNVDALFHNEFGMPAALLVRPTWAATVIAAMYTAAGAIPLLTFHLAPAEDKVPFVAVISIAILASLGGIGAAVGRVNAFRPAGRMALWGAAALLVAALVGAVCGVRS